MDVRERLEKLMELTTGRLKISSALEILDVDFDVLCEAAEDLNLHIEAYIGTEKAPPKSSESAVESPDKEKRASFGRREVRAIPLSVYKNRIVDYLAKAKEPKRRRDIELEVQGTSVTLMRAVEELIREGRVTKSQIRKTEKNRPIYGYSLAKQEKLSPEILEMMEKSNNSSTTEDVFDLKKEDEKEEDWCV